MPKRQKQSDDVEEAASIDDLEEELPSNDEGESSAGALDSESEGISGSTDTEDEIADSKIVKSKKTLKRKRRATEPSRFGATLQFLLDTDAPSAQPLSLKPSVARQRNDEKLELKARKALQIEKKEKEDKGRVTDVIGGWGGEGERALRKIAQRGVVKLFNAIQQSQASTAVAVEETKAGRGSGKPSLPAPSIDDTPKGHKAKSKNKDNIIGRGKESNVAKDDFFDMIRSGGVVSKA
ncbi:hypothetical protein FIBSPDRAFT_831320 [Athelia psychrophila]|uniref:Rrp15p-domain-containing protein n=1 Tax=Athelia psychrophila TaxID=1759441 RepID=A0A166FI46_9AGAM|nr:hypothetical protein FIBSPDRAFT_831320 [Fibularhizoctonia sp. CBS 109695]